MVRIQRNSLLVCFGILSLLMSCSGSEFGGSPQTAGFSGTGGQPPVNPTVVTPVGTPTGGFDSTGADLGGLPGPAARGGEAGEHQFRRPVPEHRGQFCHGAAGAGASARAVPGLLGDQDGLHA